MSGALFVRDFVLITAHCLIGEISEARGRAREGGENVENVFFAI